MGLVAWLRHAAIRGSSVCVSPETNDVPSGWFTCVEPSSARLVEPLYPPKPTLRIFVKTHAHAIGSSDDDADERR